MTADRLAMITEFMGQADAMQSWLSFLSFLFLTKINKSDLSL